MGKYCVYRYVDSSDWTIKYIGISTNDNLLKRCRAHTRDDWYKDGQFLCEYFEVENRSEAEAIESHLISLYGTDKYFNKAKANWGINKYLPYEYNWIIINSQRSVGDIANSLMLQSEWCLTKQYSAQTASKSFYRLYEELIASQKEQKCISEWLKLRKA